MANTATYGFVDLAHLFADRVTTVGIEQVQKAIRESAEMWSEQSQALFDELVTRTTVAKKKFELPGTGTLQPLDANGVPMPVQQGGSYDVAFPIQGGGTAWGGNRVAAALMTVEEANRHTVNAFRRDGDWLARHMLAALFDNVEWTFDDPALGSLTVVPLANGDAVTYVKVGIADAETDNHYASQAAAIADATNPFPAIHDELMEHPSNSGGEVVVYVPSNVVSDIEALADFVPVTDPKVRKGANSDELNGAIDPGLGDELVGRANRCWIVEWKRLPDNYLLGTVKGRKPIVMREYPASELQGFFAETHSPDGARFENRLIRYAGFGVEDRVAACVQQVEDVGAIYNIPTGYDAPLSI